MKLTNKTYDTLKWIAQILLPALSTLYFAMAAIWKLPYGEQVVGTLAALDAFLGVLLGLSTAQYKQATTAPDGTFQVNEQDDKDVLTFKLDKGLYDIMKKGSITLTMDKGASAQQ